MFLVLFFFYLQIGIIDPDCRLIGLHLYDGLFKVCTCSRCQLVMLLDALYLCSAFQLNTHHSFHFSIICYILTSQVVLTNATMAFKYL